MKTLISFFALLFLIVIFTGCSSTHPGPIVTAQNNTSERDVPDFVELTSGEIIEGKISNDQLAYGKGFIVINKTKYANKEVRAYQRKHKYYGKDATNEFHTRIIKGEISLYRSIMESLRHYYFLQKGKGEVLIPYNETELRNLIQDYHPAVDELNRYQAMTEKEIRSVQTNFLENIIAIYNRK